MCKIFATGISRWVPRLVGVPNNHPRHTPHKITWRKKLQNDSAFILSCPALFSNRGILQGSTVNRDTYTHICIWAPPPPVFNYIFSFDHVRSNKSANEKNTKNVQNRKTIKILKTQKSPRKIHSQHQIEININLS